MKNKISVIIKNDFSIIILLFIIIVIFLILGIFNLGQYSFLSFYLIILFYFILFIKCLVIKNKFLFFFFLASFIYMNNYFLSLIGTDKGCMGEFTRHMLETGNKKAYLYKIKNKEDGRINYHIETQDNGDLEKIYKNLLNYDYKKIGKTIGCKFYYNKNKTNVIERTASIMVNGYTCQLDLLYWKYIKPELKYNK